MLRRQNRKALLFPFLPAFDESPPPPSAPKRNRQFLVKGSHPSTSYHESTFLSYTDPLLFHPKTQPSFSSPPDERPFPPSLFPLRWKRFLILRTFIHQRQALGPPPSGTRMFFRNIISCFWELHPILTFFCPPLLRLFLSQRESSRPRTENPT